MLGSLCPLSQCDTAILDIFNFSAKVFCETFASALNSLSLSLNSIQLTITKFVTIRLIITKIVTIILMLIKYGG